MQNASMFSSFKVGAAVLGGDGQIYPRCNIESQISGLGICAERYAVDHAVLHESGRIKEIAIVMNFKKHEKPKPCGICLRYIHYFSKDSKI